MYACYVAINQTQTSVSCVCSQHSGTHKLVMAPSYVLDDLCSIVHIYGIYPNE